MKNSWREEWKAYAGRVMAPDSYGAEYQSAAWAKSEAFWLKGITELLSPANPVVGPKTNLPGTAGGLCDIAVNLFACEPKRTLARRYAGMSVAVCDKALEREAFWRVSPDTRNDPVVLQGGRAKTVRARLYSQWLLGNGNVDPTSLVAISDDFEASAEGSRKRRQWMDEDKVFIMAAIRTALIAGDLDRAQASVKIKRPFTGFLRQFGAHSRLVKAIAASGGAALPAEEIEAFEWFFDALRYPDEAIRNQSERGAKHIAEVFGEEALYTNIKIVAFELALIKDKYVHGNASPDLDRIIGYITE